MHKTKAISEAGKQKIYIDFVYTIIYSSPQYDFFGRNAGLPFHSVSGGSYEKGYCIC